MGEPGFWERPEDDRKKVITELKRLKALVAPLAEMTKRLDDEEVLFQLAAEENDSATFEEVFGNLGKLKDQVDAFELRAIMSGPFDPADAYLSINAGAGGTDAADWAQILLRMYTRYLGARGFEIKVLDIQPHEEAGIKSATVEVHGDYAYGTLKSEMGVHRLVRISPFDAAGRRQTSFAAVDVVPADDEEEVDIEINEGDLRIDYYRAGGVVLDLGMIHRER